jgi:predicted MFS family arabinose efflux permease
MRKIYHVYKDAYSGLSASTWWLCLIMLVNRSGTMVVPFMTMYLTQQLHVGIAKAGLVMSLFGAGAIVGALIGGKITDKVGCYKVQLITLALGGILFIVLGQMKSYTSICVVSFILSMVNEAFRPANAVAIAQYSTAQNRTRSYSLNRLAVNLGWAFGAALGGFIAASNYTWLFWVDGITNLLAALLLVLLLRPQKNAASAPVAASSAPAPSVYHDKMYHLFIVLQVLFAICFFQMYTIQPVYYKTQLGLSENFIGANMALNGLIIAAVEMVLVYRLERRKSPLFFIGLGTLLIGICYLLTNVLPMPAASLAITIMVGITVGEMLSMPFMNAWWIARTQNGNRGQYAALYTVAWSIAQIIGPIVGGSIAEHQGYRALWLYSAVACALLALVYWLMMVRAKSATS